MVDFGQLVIGPPGSGKTTYCEGMTQLFSLLKRPYILVNLDFANDWETKLLFSRRNKGTICEFSEPDVDVRELVNVEQVMREKSLGPNGSLLYCCQYLSANVEWLKSKIKEAKGRKKLGNAYVIIDMPGQVELYTCDNSMKIILESLNDRNHGIRLVAIHLIDSTLCTQLHHYISALLISLSAQIGLEVPFLNVFTKTDLLKDEDLEKNQLSLEFLAKAEDLEYLLPIAHPALSKGSSASHHHQEVKFGEFNKSILQLVDEFNLVGFLPLDIQDKESALSILSMADQACGFAMSAYFPSRSRLPGRESEEDGLRYDCGLQKKVLDGSEWFKR